MKKAIAITAVIFCLLSMMILSSCGKTTDMQTESKQSSQEPKEEIKDKVAIDREQYKASAEQCGLSYKEDESTLNGLTDGKFATAWKGYMGRSGEVDSFFYVFNDEADAKTFADGRRNRYLQKEDSKDNSAANFISAEYTSVMSDYTQREYFCQVDNTVFIISYTITDEEFKALGEKLIKSIGY